MNQTQEEILTLFIVAYAVITTIFVLWFCLLGSDPVDDTRAVDLANAIKMADDGDAPQIPAFGLGIESISPVITTKTLQANHPLVKKTLEDLQADLWDIGFQHRKHGGFYTLTNVTMENNVLYCEYKGKKVSVARILSKECGFRSPRWMNYLIVKHYGDHQINYIPFKDYVVQKHNLVFS